MGIPILEFAQSTNSVLARHRFYFCIQKNKKRVQCQVVLVKPKTNDK